MGAPVEPEVKRMNAASLRRGRVGGGASARRVITPRPATRNRAPVAARVACVAASGAARATGTATPPAAQTPRKAAMSSGALATRHQHRLVCGNAFAAQRRCGLARRGGKLGVAQAAASYPRALPRRRNARRPRTSAHRRRSPISRSFRRKPRVAPGNGGAQAVLARDLHEALLVERAFALDAEVDSSASFSASVSPVNSKARLMARLVFCTRPGSMTAIWRASASAVVLDFVCARPRD